MLLLIDFVKKKLIFFAQAKKKKLILIDMHLFVDNKIWLYS